MGQVAKLLCSSVFRTGASDLRTIHGDVTQMLSSGSSNSIQLVAAHRRPILPGSLTFLPGHLVLKVNGCVIDEIGKTFFH